MHENLGTAPEGGDAVWAGQLLGSRSAEPSLLNHALAHFTVAI